MVRNKIGVKKESDSNTFQEEISKDVKDVELWVIARRKFFKRLLKVVLLTLILYLLIKLI